jgi:glycosyltransferase involved in cell wall biosynthesis
LELAKKFPQMDFHIVGGNENDIQMWQSGHIDENVHFHGHVSPHDTWRYRNAFDIFLAPYQKSVSVAGGEGNTVRFMSPLKIFEYMSAKKTIIVSDLPVLREVLDNESAIFVKPDDISQWTDALQSTLDDSLRKKLSQNAYEKFIHNYTWDKRARMVLNAIDIKDSTTNSSNIEP